MAVAASVVARDRVYPATRILSLVIIPFLLLAFVLLYFWPSAADTERLFAWRISPGFTSMVLASAYLGGAYFFARAAIERQWHRIAGGFLPVVLFAGLLGIATVLHWDRFIHTNVAFWLWAGLYFTTPALVLVVWLSNRREVSGIAADDVLLTPVVAALIGSVGVAACAISLFLFLFPTAATAVWPWSLTMLTARVVGAIFALGFAAIGAFVDRRWSSARLLVQVAMIMLGLMLIAAVRSIGDFDTSRPLTWAMGFGFVALMVGLCLLYLRMEARRQVAARAARSAA